MAPSDTEDVDMAEGSGQILTENNGVADTTDYTDSETQPNTSASSVAGDIAVDGRKRRAEEFQLRKKVLGKQHDRLHESQVCSILRFCKLG